MDSSQPPGSVGFKHNPPGGWEKPNSRGGLGSPCSSQVFLQKGTPDSLEIPVGQRAKREVFALIRADSSRLAEASGCQYDARLLDCLFDSFFVPFLLGLSRGSGRQLFLVLPLTWGSWVAFQVRVVPQAFASVLPPLVCSCIIFRL
jgi:hypothetical protein